MYECEREESVVGKNVFYTVLYYTTVHKEKKNPLTGNRTFLRHHDSASALLSRDKGKCGDEIAKERLWMYVSKAQEYVDCGYVDILVIYSLQKEFLKFHCNNISTKSWIHYGRKR